MAPFTAGFRLEAGGGRYGNGRDGDDRRRGRLRHTGFGFRPVSVSAFIRVNQWLKGGYSLSVIGYLWTGLRLSSLNPEGPFSASLRLCGGNGGP